ncbi:multiple sugar transport system permease protein [Rhizobiales bacterium GAS188]|nr:multiple sugar transport system permease protein [Rhizobiales bacterium GAS188]
MKRADPVQWAMVAPAQALLILVIALPAAYVFWLSLAHSSYGQVPVWAGWDNYRTILADRYFWRALVNTLIVVNAVVYIELAVALGMAVLFAGGIPARRVMIAVVLAPYAISEVVAVMVWRYLMEPDIGPVTHLIAALGLPPLDWSVSPGAALALVGLINIWMHLPFTFVLLYTALLAVPAELFEAARIDGASAWAEFRHVTLPVLMPAILVAILFRYVFAFRTFSEVWLLTQGGPARSTEVLAVYLYTTGFRYGDFGGAAAIGWLMLLASLLLALYYLRRMYRGMLADA